MTGTTREEEEVVRCVAALVLAFSVVLPLGEVRSQDPDYTLFMESQEVFAGDTFEIPVLGTWAGTVTGYSLSLAFTSSPPLLNLAFSIEDTIVEDLDPEFLNINFNPSVGEVIVGLLFELTPPFSGSGLPAVDFPLKIGDFRGLVPPGTPPQSVTFNFLDGLGTPATDNLFVVETVNSVNPTLLSGGTLTVLPPLPPPPMFLRGDVNADGSIDIGDILFHLNYTFQDGPLPLCADAGDANDDGLSDITDAVYLVCYLFAMGEAPPEPFPSVGADPTEDGIGCENPVQ